MIWMEPFRNFSGIVAPLDRLNVDTDQVIPKQFLKLVGRTGFGRFLFYDWRYEANGHLKHDFVLNAPRYQGAEILLARANFGCGSSREHAVWALADYGFRVLLAPSFADIFYNNCFKNGLLPICLSDTAINDLFEEVVRQDGYRMEVDLAGQRLCKPHGDSVHFEIEADRKKRLLQGLDDIELTLRHKAEIEAYERQLKPFQIIDSGIELD